MGNHHLYVLYLSNRVNQHPAMAAFRVTLNKVMRRKYMTVNIISFGKVITDLKNQAEILINQSFCSYRHYKKYYVCIKCAIEAF